MHHSITTCIIRLAKRMQHNLSDELDLQHKPFEVSIGSDARARSDVSCIRTHPHCKTAFKVLHNMKQTQRTFNKFNHK
jgi:hypothetical protein